MSVTQCLLTIENNTIDTRDVLYVQTDPTYDDRYDELIHGYTDIYINFRNGPTLEITTHQVDDVLDKLSIYPLVRTGDAVINVHMIKTMTVDRAYNARYDEFVDGCYRLIVTFIGRPTRVIEIYTDDPKGFTVPDSSSSDEEDDEEEEDDDY